MLLGVTSLLSVPISDGVTGYGVLTLGRQAAEGRFTIADLALAEELGEHLGVAIRVDRMFRHRSAVAEALQGSLLPARLPEVPGVDLSAAYVPASEGLEVSGDFYDVFPVQGGWAITVGDVCGKGQEAAAMTAAARHAIRVIAHWNPDPVQRLGQGERGHPGRRLRGPLRHRQACLPAVGGLPGPGGAGQFRAPGPGRGAPGRPRSRAERRWPAAWPVPGRRAGARERRARSRTTCSSSTPTSIDARSPDMQYYEDRLADELVGAAGNTAAGATRMIQEQDRPLLPRRPA